MGIRNLLVANPQNAEIERFGNGLPRQCAHWLAMTGFFDSLEGDARSASPFFACGVGQTTLTPALFVHKMFTIKVKESQITLLTK